MRESGAPGRVLFLVTSMARGGAERQVVDLAATLRARGWQVLVVSMVDPTDFESELRDAGVGLASLGMRQGRPSLRGLLAYSRLVRRWRPTVVHAHMVHANLLARIGRILTPTVPVVSTVHNVNEGHRWRELAYRATHRLSALTTAVSRAAAHRYVAVGAVPTGGILVVPNGVNVSRRASPSEIAAVRAELDFRHDEFTWITVGRLVPAKGHDILLSAFREVRHRAPRTRLLIAGEGELRASLAAQIATLELGEHVSLLGERRDIPALLAASSAFVLSSRWEGLPMVLLEASAQSLPIVSTDVGGCGEIARPELGARLVEPTSTSVAEGMLEMMGEVPARRAEIGAALLKHVRAEYDLGAIVGRWERLYASISGRW